MTAPSPPPEPVESDGARLVVFRRAPALDGRRTAALGRFEIASPEAGARLLADVAERLRAEGVEALLAPMDGDTWHSYRLVVESDGSPPFLMEPPENAALRAALEAASFAPIATYASARAPLADIDEPPDMPGVALQSWDGGDPERFLADVHALSCEAFARNPFYLPLDRAGFDALYRPLLPRLDARLMHFARDEAGDLLGFVFGVPDMLNPASRTAILKTLASRRRGVGRLLSAAFNRAAHEAGFVSVIHALMHEENRSVGNSAKMHGTVFRRYALYGRML